MDKDRQPRSGINKNRVRIVSARFSELEYQALQKRRKDAGVSLSSFTRSAMLAGKVVQRISKADADTLRKLAGEANNLNQLAHKANAGGFAGVATELIAFKKKIVTIINQLSDDWQNKQRGNF
ncbi:MobC family plasmid mobilization relaxosome protein [Bacteroides neonati]|uniref:MobC family plasmid mobilization relaxosome protein n=1 Tax=Bacteroides neonati TaxID=1347393 RepID=UPI0005AA2F9F|nr:MobC family plasmid mobilization relaxosome protein [Bacteroides neonati]